ncbi:MAG: ATP-binding protein [Prolixibacteraceae bacterium]|nr:ATP-binding protein [Prolixibacteraceae bacterium]MBN2648838.1 ATP-binding protein [Prolixibacteraceae bacterium]
MTKKIAIASGKGGTGKTTVSVNLFHFLNALTTQKIKLIDCDVEEPNDLLFFPEAQCSRQQTVHQMIPEIDTSKCTFCRKCAEYCEYNAITIIPKLKHAEVTSSLCHSCGACTVACEYGAITEHPVEVGEIKNFTNGMHPNGEIIEGRLKIGSAMQTLMIKETKKSVQNAELMLIDAPPGTSCPVVESVADADYVILVTEPTPFGLHDLKLMVDLLDDVDKPYGVIINKAGLGNDETHRYLIENNIELLGEIPFTRAYASKYASGNLLNDIPAEIENMYREIVSVLLEKLK